MDGKIQGNASPRINVELYGFLGRHNPPTLLEAIVDTGFTGGVSIPITQALPLGLMLFSTASFVLADNSTENTFLCLGAARLDEEERPMVFSLTKGRDVLIGTEFLKVFSAKLELDYKTDNFSLKIQKPDTAQQLPPAPSALPS